ncbi:hypothetical protein [Flavobacterium caseinilyticum]|uniref:Uncharacterized protein n=1 Tax=Flavobacterium caseinilyticum TaxID=2541732 RepID=A0A4R5AYF2_9FLAO|nr:hypothetical protein [Flavobacterium caseinilyticum]TDD77159.1 hypothetical protein E0F89_06045 [Flavobacterium caseinilyticum]
MKKAIIIIWTFLTIVLLILGIYGYYIQNKIIDIEKRAYQKLTEENKDLIEFIIFGESQE